MNGGRIQPLTGAVLWLAGKENAYLMEILGIGPLEIVLVLILALVVLGPQDMVATARKIGLWVRKFTRSEMWAEIMDTSREIRQIPNALLRDTGLQEAANDLKQAGSMIRGEVNEAGASINSAVQQASQEVRQQASQQAAVPEADAPALQSPPISTTPTGMPPLSPDFPRVQPSSSEEGSQPSDLLPPEDISATQPGSGSEGIQQSEPEA